MPSVIKYSFTVTTSSSRPKWARAGQRLRDFRGNVARITKIAGDDITMSAAGWPEWSVTVTELTGYIKDGWWIALPDETGAQLRCQKCGDQQHLSAELENGCCWGCRHGF